jgi:hypothetical protein
MEKKYDRILFGFFGVKSCPIEIDIVAAVKLDSLPSMHNLFAGENFLHRV